MKIQLSYHQVLLAVFISMLTTSTLRSEEICKGNKSRYHANDLAGATYAWGIEDLTGKTYPQAIIKEYPNGDSIDVHWNLPLGDYYITVIEILDNCESAKIKKPVTLIGRKSDSVKDSLVKFCSGDSIVLEAVKGLSNYLWMGNIAGSSIRVNKAGKYWVDAITADGCPVSDTFQVETIPLPVIDLGPDKRLCNNGQITINLNPNLDSIRWSTGETTNEITIFIGDQKSIRTWVIAKDTTGCANTDTAFFYSCDVNDFIKNVPSAFTPNDDGVNETWQLPYVTDYPNMVVEIYDRWGNLIFKSSKGYKKPWTGKTDSGRLYPMDAYYYIIDLKDGSDPITGSITLLR